MSQDSLHALWTQMTSDDVQAFEQLYQLVAHDLLIYGKSLTHDHELVKEELQNLFLTIWNKRKSNQVPDQVRSYLFRAFRNNVIRSSQQAQKVLYKVEDRIEEGVNEEENLHAHSIKDIIESLPNRQKEVIKLRYFQGLDHQEIAQVLDMNYQSVSNLIARAIKKLREKMTGK